MMSKCERSCKENVKMEEKSVLERGATLSDRQDCATLQHAGRGCWLVEIVRCNRGLLHCIVFVLRFVLGAVPGVVIGVAAIVDLD